MKYKFRGKMNKTDDFVYGSLLVTSMRWGSKTQIVTESLDEESEDVYTHVHPMFTGQFTGLKDRHGNEIYEGDIVNEDLARDGKWQSVGVVEFFEGSFGSRNKHNRFRIPALFSGDATKGMNLNYYEIIGNIHQNPELITEELTK